MSDTRLSFALEGGLDLPSEGRILLLGAPGDFDASALPRERCTVVQRSAPDFAAWERRGWDVATAPEGEFAAAIVFLPRARDRAETWIAEACAAAKGGLVIVDGQKIDGIDTALKAVRKRTEVTGQVSKAHGKSFWFAATDALADWARGPAQLDGGQWTAPGVFSADGPDPASEALLAALPQKLGTNVADLGAGWGGLANGILTREKIGALHLVEADLVALDCARRNVTDPRAQFHWADALNWTPPALLDAVVMNPPFHTNRRKAEPSLGQAFIDAAARMLKPSGQLWLVANRHLPYETRLAERFRNSDEIAGDARFKILHASRPGR
ncbi:class I SAM-dependent methyltransferase [Salipiger sp. PrR002]|uniref:class I SAM-dependent methyltransferase n=1 Tax=Salipiger sp. PrR002 TaxID=2706489 RepID=UPI0013BBF3D6|nr:methyltransferase [Salipiger sp. PrR002]NDW01576.1 class I SAM-dependent methyltransferase [Salipiger sp. PrR002]NDW58287.1 class I SAM-dependent methyltransferase [Salipiger sp. PrR004]